MRKATWMITYLICLCLAISCESQRLLASCDFDSGLKDFCRFDATPGAPMLQSVYGFQANGRPTRPLSDVKAITLATSNNERCTLPYTYEQETWETYFCRLVAGNTSTCHTTLGMASCNTGMYGLVTTTTTANQDHTYTTINTVQSSGSVHCLDFYYYMTDNTSNSYIRVGWSAGLGTTWFATLSAPPQNRWNRVRLDYNTGMQQLHYLGFKMIRSSGSTGFSFAFDEIKVYAGSCGSTPVITTTSTPTTTTTMTTWTTTSTPTTTTTVTTWTTTSTPTTTTTMATWTTTSTPTTTTTMTTWTITDIVTTRTNEWTTTHMLVNTTVPVNSSAIESTTKYSTQMNESLVWTTNGVTSEVDTSNLTINSWTTPVTTTSNNSNQQNNGSFTTVHTSTNPGISTVAITHTMTSIDKSDIQNTTLFDNGTNQVTSTRTLPFSSSITNVLTTKCNGHYQKTTSKSSPGRP